MAYLLTNARRDASLAVAPDKWSKLMKQMYQMNTCEKCSCIDADPVDSCIWPRNISTSKVNIRRAPSWKVANKRKHMVSVVFPVKSYCRWVLSNPSHQIEQYLSNQRISVKLCIQILLFLECMSQTFRFGSVLALLHWVLCLWHWQQFTHWSLYQFGRNKTNYNLYIYIYEWITYIYILDQPQIHCKA